MLLAHWQYTKEEWKNFMRSTGRQLTLWQRLFRRLSLWKTKQAPIVRITVDKICIGEEQQYFNSGRHLLRHIDLRNENSVNILAITYRRAGAQHEIKVPVPKGKLREAVQVQEHLNEQQLV